MYKKLTAKELDKLNKKKLELITLICKCNDELLIDSLLATIKNENSCIEIKQSHKLSFEITDKNKEAFLLEYLLLSQQIGDLTVEQIDGKPITFAILEQKLNKVKLRDAKRLIKSKK